MMPIPRCSPRRLCASVASAALLAGLAGLGGCGGGGAQAPAATDPLAQAPQTPATPAAPAASAPTSAVATPSAGVPSGYALVWSDEFEANGLPDAAKWTADTERNRAGWYNNELQYYSADRVQNAVVQDGLLRITARREDLSGLADWGGQRYSSTRLITRGNAEWTYGFFDVRARMPCGQGTWPAIWLLGSGGRWPQDGEIDIMEHVGSNPSRIQGTVHTQAGSGGASQGGAIQISDACTAFHNYQVHWSPDGIDFLVDGQPYFRYANPRQGAGSWPFDAPQFMILNLAIGGDLGGAVNDSIFPVSFAIDHVRVYQARP